MIDVLSSLGDDNDDGRMYAGGPGVMQCSRRGCRNEATWQLLWNNPKIHAPDRRKTWVACDEHKDWLQQYLTDRSLWRETLPLNFSEAGPASDSGTHDDGRAS